MHDKWILEGVRAAHLVVANRFSATVPVLRRLVTKEALLAFELYVVTSIVPPATFLVDSPPGQVYLTAPPEPCKSIKILASVIAWIWNEVTISHVHEPADGHRWCGWAVFNCDVHLFYLASCQSTWS